MKTLRFTDPNHNFAFTVEVDVKVDLIEGDNCTIYEVLGLTEDVIKVGFNLLTPEVTTITRIKQLAESLNLQLTVFPENTGLITQLYATPSVLVLPFVVGGAATPVTIASNTSWTVTKEASMTWLTIAPTSGTNNGSITLTASANAGAQRTGIVTVTTSKGSKTINITQAGV